MPRYDFTCQNCGIVFGETVLANDTQPIACPECKKTDLVRHFPAPAVHTLLSPGNPRYKRGIVGHKILAPKPQFRDDAPFLKKRKKKNA
jgi:putative FmdB family regulatory protein